MKNKIKFFVIIALVVTIGFSMAGCKEPGPDRPLVAGSFSYTGGSARFYADYASGRSVRVVAGMPSNNRVLEGKIEDGDIIFNLKGIYNTVDNTFSLSAGSSMLVFQINGKLSGGNMTNTRAKINVYDGSNWTGYEVNVSSNSSVTIGGSASNTQKDGIPQAWCGTWIGVSANDPTERATYIFTPYEITSPDFPGDVFPFIDILSTSGGKHEILGFIHVVEYDGPYGGPIVSEEWDYVKIWLEESENGLVFTAFYGSMGENITDAKTYNTALANYSNQDDPNYAFKVNFNRP